MCVCVCIYFYVYIEIETCPLLKKKKKRNNKLKYIIALYFNQCKNKIKLLQYLIKLLFIVVQNS